MREQGYCEACGQWVDLTGAGDCPAGHAAEAIVRTRDGAAKREAGPVPRTAVPQLGESTDRLATVLGRALIIVPAALVLLVAILVTEPQYEGAGMSPALAWIAAAASTVLTLGLAALWGWLRFKRRRR